MNCFSYDCVYLILDEIRHKTFIASINKKLYGLIKRLKSYNLKINPYHCLDKIGLLKIIINYIPHPHHPYDYVGGLDPYFHWDDEIYERITKRGNLECVQWAYYSNRLFVVAEDIMYFAAKYNHLHIVKWIYEHGTEINCASVAIAGKMRNIEILQWFYEHVVEE